MQLQFSPFPELTTERLILRQINLADSPEILKFRSDPEVMKYIDRPRARTVVEAAFWINTVQRNWEDNEAITWGIQWKTAPTLLGTIGFWRIVPEHFRAEIGYLLDSGLHGQGITPEAMRTVIRYGFDVMKLHSIEANVNPQNTASRKLLERNGFEQEGYFKESFYYDGKFLDNMVYSRLNH